MTALEHLRPVVPRPFAILAQVHHRRDHALPRHLPQVAQAKRGPLPALLIFLESI